MLHEILYTEYERIGDISRPVGIDLTKETVRTYQALFTYWNKSLGSDKICILGFVINRTLRYGKYAEKIPFSAFMEGVQTEEEGMICAPVGVSHNTFRRILRELIVDNFLMELYPKKIPGKKDVAVRYFEINFKKIQHRRYEEEGEIMVLLRTPKVKKEARLLPNLVVPKMGVQSSDNEHTIVCNGIAKAILVGESDDRRTASRVEQVLAKLKADQSANRAARTEKAKSTPTTYLKKIDVQTMIDNAMREHAPTLPRTIVTDKAFGVLKKRLIESAPASLPEFFTFVVSRWDQISAGHYKASIKRMHRGEAKDIDTRLGRAPDFATLAFRYPYFLKCYATHLVERAVLGAPEDRKDLELKQSKRALAHARAENEELKRKVYSRPRVAPAEPEATPTATRIKRAPRAVLREEDDLPDWDTFNAQRKKA